MKAGRSDSFRLKTPPWTEREFESRLRAKAAGGHIHHPFNRRLNEGELQPYQVRGWVANHFYYQVHIPIRGVALVSNRADRSVRHYIKHMPDRSVRGNLQGEDVSGVGAWVRLGEAVGLSPVQMWSHKYVVPGVRFAVQAYINFARENAWHEAVISQLTELLAPKVRDDSLGQWPTLYPWIDTEGLACFRSHVAPAMSSVERELQIALQWCGTRQRQQSSLQILQFKLDILWTILDSIERAYPDDLEFVARP